MTRTQKIEYIKRKYPDLYIQLQRSVPTLISNPENSCEKDIHIYNQFIVWQAGLLEDKYVLENLSF